MDKKSKKAAGLRWSKFWWEDWLSDPALRFCSAAARGVWMDLLCMAHKGTPYGHVTVNGRVPTDRQISSIVGVPVDELAPLLIELEECGVFSRRGSSGLDQKTSSTIAWLETEGHFQPCEDGVIFSRRMVRDIAAHIKGKEMGAKGGNPALIGEVNSVGHEVDKQPPYEGGLTPPLTTPPDPLEAKRLEAKKEREEKSRPSSDAVASPKPTQASLLPEPPKPPPTTGQLLWSEGLDTFCRLTGGSPSKARPAFRKLELIAGPEALLDVLRDCAENPPRQAFSWITKACEERAKKAAGPRLVFSQEIDPMDDWGVQAFCQSLPGVKPTEHPMDKPHGKWFWNNLIIDNCLRKIMAATGLPGSWRGDMSIILSWLESGLSASNDIVPAIQRVVNAGRFDANKPLAYFNPMLTSTKGAA
jgi:hypothetical protein